jgi:hypothetical protein
MIFLDDSRYYPAPACLVTVDFQNGRRHILARSHQPGSHHSKQELLICRPIGVGVGFRREFVLEAFNLLYFRQGSYQPPSTYQIQDFLTRLCKDRPLSELTTITDEPTERRILQWVVSLGSI